MDSRGSTYQAHILNGTFLEQKNPVPCGSVIDWFHCIVSEFIWRAWE